MKKTLLFIALFVASFGFAQTFDNIPTGTGIYINKLIPSPSGDDLTKEYFEIRGTANAVVPSDLYLIAIEGDGNSSSRGKVTESISLGDGTRTFGANGMLVIITNYTQDSGGSTSLENLDGTYASPFAGLISSDAAIIEIALSGGDLGSSSSSAVSGKNPDIGYDGNFSDQTGTYMLVSASSNPKNVRIDGGADATAADGVIDATGDHTSWVLYDSITYMDDNDEGAGEYGYGQIIIAQDNANKSADQHTTTSATVYDFSASSDVNIMMRLGTSTGYGANDWAFAASSNNGNPPNWSFSSTTGKAFPDVFSGWDELNLYYGQLNPTAASLSIDDVFASKVAMYPNPANDFVTISSSVEINNIEVYSLLGEKVISTSKLTNNNLDVSSLAKGVYVLKIMSDNLVASKKIIIE